ncbi:hypothetical protein BATDEDRAFT_21285 [Batrachochytrium dendrobatidis JAM81]|uniref:G-protein coupled receptors family 1 profile domain-containing protein n=1 Tax=Batrachochytrium dendrobatidis (strain JAM81 / FGSC 10211) TaxID=684364 RepID=F4NS73_BATDJ|nr:uncharacterized protein BATDEDRAFT_21285 [Batrachochytrium dendrobatidis JAM81]EGF82995.1 hypothetical protein BATDEDRAFT_21285 [Batrachochytrium dendrobatidis JAM81]|eukprot:XP_006675243.1 hypothetical protein BATDEDRAFT_21285 [Batrachochytrium dendrobatidis JAM81]
MDGALIWFLLAGLGCLALASIIINTAMVMILFRSRYVMSLQNILYIHLASSNLIYGILTLAQIVSPITAWANWLEVSFQKLEQLSSQRQKTGSEDDAIQCRLIAITTHFFQMLSLCTLVAIARHHSLVYASLQEKYRFKSSLLQTQSLAPFLKPNKESRSKISTVYRSNIALWIAILWSFAFAKSLLVVLGSAHYTFSLAQKFCVTSFNDSTQPGKTLHSIEAIGSLVMAAVIIRWYMITASSHSKSTEYNTLHESSINQLDLQQHQNRASQHPHKNRNALRISIAGILVLFTKSIIMAYEIHQGKPISLAWLGLIVDPGFGIIYTLITGVMFFILHRRVMRKMLEHVVRSTGSPNLHASTSSENQYYTGKPSITTQISPRPVKLSEPFDFNRYPINQSRPLSALVDNYQQSIQTTPVKTQSIFQKSVTASLPNSTPILNQQQRSNHTKLSTAVHLENNVEYSSTLLQSIPSLYTKTELKAPVAQDSSQSPRTTAIVMTQIYPVSPHRLAVHSQPLQYKSPDHNKLNSSETASPTLTKSKSYTPNAVVDQSSQTVLKPTLASQSLLGSSIDQLNTRHVGTRKRGAGLALQQAPPYSIV